MSGINNAYDAFRTSNKVVVMKEKVEEMLADVYEDIEESASKGETECYLHTDFEARDHKVYRAAIHKLLEDGFMLISEYQFSPSYGVGERLKIEWKR